MSRPRPSAYLIDLDGTLYTGGSAVPGAVEALARLRSAGIPFRLVTNTSSRSRLMLLDRLRLLGFEVEAHELFTAPMAAADLASREGYQLAVPFVPEPALSDLSGLKLAGGTSGRAWPFGPRADVVLVGDLGARWSHAFMQEAFEHLMTGAALVALSRDRYWLRDGRLTLDAGPFVAGLEYASGRRAAVAGKPSAGFYRAAVATLGDVSPAKVAMIGDDLWSDVAGAQAAGLMGWLVRTGKFRPETLEDGEVAPDRVLESVAELPGE